MRNFTAKSIEEQIATLLTSWGMDPVAAGTAAHVMAETDASGIDSHGISMLMRYEDMHLQGRLDVTAAPEVVSESAASVVIDAHHGLGHPAAVMAVDLAIDKAFSAGVAIATVRNSHHFGAAGLYVRRAAERGLLGLVTSTTSVPSVIPPGGEVPVLGTNPLAFAAPVAGSHPFVVDMSTSTVAVNKVKAYALAGKELPSGWVTGADGEDLTDADEAFSALMQGAGAGLSPLGGSSVLWGGHKGLGLSMMVQLLSTSLVAAPSPGHEGNRHQIGHVFIVIDPDLAGVAGDAAACNADFIAHLRASRSTGEDLLTIPGDPEAAALDVHRSTGVPLPDTLIEKIEGVCERSSVPLVLQTV